MDDPADPDDPDPFEDEPPDPVEEVLDDASEPAAAEEEATEPLRESVR
ncbi:hypothetical protein [Ornithinimicrobium sp. F0845]